jgi:hypothetical protein
MPQIGSSVAAWRDMVMPGWPAGMCVDGMGRSLTAVPVLFRCASATGWPAGSAGELLDQQVHGEVNAQRADLIAAQVVDD